MVCNKIGKERLYFDGAMGTMLQNRGLKLGEIPELYNMTHPEIIEEIHREYLVAGSQFITTNTFGANRYKLNKTDYTVEEISRIVGGLVGEFWDNPVGRAGLKNCLYTGKIYAKNFMLGGLVGQIYCNAVIEDCLSNGEIYAEWGSRLSSIVGWTAGTRTLTFRNVYGITKLY